MVGVESEIRLFADDCIVSLIALKTHRNSKKRILIQLGKWARKWDMRFHPVKCKVMQLTRKRIKNNAVYSLTGTVCENVWFGSVLSFFFFVFFFFCFLFFCCFFFCFVFCLHTFHDKLVTLLFWTGIEHFRKYKSSNNVKYSLFVMIEVLFAIPLLPHCNLVSESCGLQMIRKYNRYYNSCNPILNRNRTFQ